MKPKILIVDDEPAARHGLRRALSPLDCEIVEAADGVAALAAIEESIPDLIICDLQMPRMDGVELLKALDDSPKAPRVIMLTAHGSERTAVEAMKTGAYDYLSKPYEVDELRCIVDNALETVRLRSENQALRTELEQRSGFGMLSGQSKAMETVYDLIGKVAATDATVLIGGENGTGKELVARTIHAQSGRDEHSFVAMSAAALPTDLIESEMFGHEKGAFTGATERRIGKFELAHKGTLFLDEIGDMSLETQAKLLRVLQERSFERLGGNETVTVDIRLISATNRDLPADITAGRFREDLYYRLQVVDIELPPLRHRREDVPSLVYHFLDRFNQQHGKNVSEVQPDVMKLLVEHSWPGNVRQLMNVVERAVILTDGSDLTMDALSQEVRTASAQSVKAGQAVWREELSFQEAKFEAVQSFETAFICAALEDHGGNISRAASAIGMKRQALQQKIKELGIDPDVYRQRSKE